MHILSVRSTIRAAWETFKKRPLFFISVVVVVMIVTGILSSLGDNKGPTTVLTVLLGIAITILNLLIEMGLISFAIHADEHPDKASWRDLWHPVSFWSYLAVKILEGIIVVIGLILLIVPGIIAALTFIFATYLVIDRAMGPIAAMQESMRITKGNRWKLFLLVLTLLALNILGALALLVGLLVSIPVSLLAMAHAYRTLAGTARTHA